MADLNTEVRISRVIRPLCSQLEDWLTGPFGEDREAELRELIRSWELQTSSRKPEKSKEVKKKEV